MTMYISKPESVFTNHSQECFCIKMKNLDPVVVSKPVVEPVCPIGPILPFLHLISKAPHLLTSKVLDK